MAMPGMRRSVQDGFWGNAPLVQRRSRGGNGLAIQLKNFHASTDPKPQSSGLQEST